jgi:hypothetical protein
MVPCYGPTCFGTDQVINVPVTWKRYAKPCWIDSHGAPRLSAAFEAAVKLTTHVSEASAQARTRLEAVAARLAAGIPFSRVDGAFMTFGPLPDEIDLGHLLTRLQSPTLRKGDG